MSAHHKEMADYPWLECSESGCTFRNKSTQHMANHKQFSHTTNRAHTCPECSKTLRSLKGFKNHMALNSGEILRRIPCEWYGCESVPELQSHESI